MSYMKKLFFSLILIVVIGGLGLMFINNQKGEDGSVKPSYKSVNGLNIQLIDVREPFEYKDSHASGAVNIPLSKLNISSLKELDHNHETWIYCKSGDRAELARQILEKLGFKKVKNIGGLDDWYDNGGKVCKTEKKDC